MHVSKDYLKALMMEFTSKRQIPAHLYKAPISVNIVMPPGDSTLGGIRKRG